jgi:hypothetical protein
MQGYNFIFIPVFALLFCGYSYMLVTSFFLFLLLVYTLFFIPDYALQVGRYSYILDTAFGKLFHEFMNRPAMIYHHFIHAIRFRLDIF